MAPDRRNRATAFLDCAGVRSGLHDAEMIAVVLAGPVVPGTVGPSGVDLSDRPAPMLVWMALTMPSRWPCECASGVTIGVRAAAA